MTYARARLWLGISGVGSLVTLCTIALCFGLPGSLFASSGTIGLFQVLQLVGLAVALMLWLAPFDFLGGYLLPKKFDRQYDSFSVWAKGYLKAAIGQSVLFVVFASLILFAGQSAGLLGGIFAVGAGAVFCFIMRGQLMDSRRVTEEKVDDRVTDAISLIQSWRLFVPAVFVVHHRDPGFTGGIVGLGKRTKIVIPRAWLDSMSTEQLATAIARRAIAINSGSYLKGVVVAVVWNVAGFLLSSLLPSAGLDSVAALATTICGFTVWSFIGLLILPTLSRNASLEIDTALSKLGTPTELISATASSMDRMQDDEPDRPKWIERIFHPVPCVQNRNTLVRGPSAWNVARNTLFFSWACFGVLSRAVHCNVGRPELWTMLPTD